LSIQRVLNREVFFYILSLCILEMNDKHIPVLRRGKLVEVLEYRPCLWHNKSKVVSESRLLRKEREESEVAVSHVVFLGTE